KIKFVPTDSAGYLTKFQTALMAGTELPDVALQESGWRGALFALDCWENLEAAPYNFDRSVVFPQILPTMVNSRNEVIGIERELNPSGLIYKRPLAKKWLGTDDPDQVGALISDWDKFIEVGKKLVKDSNGAVKMFAGLDEIVNITRYQYTDPVFEGSKAYVTKFFTSQLDLLLKAHKENLIGKVRNNTPAWNQSFLEDAYIFYPAAPWTAQWQLKPNDPDSKGRWGMTTAPVRGYNYGGTAYGIPAKAKNKAQAWTFIKWATTTNEGIQACMDVVGAIVSLQSAYAKGFPQKPDPYFAGQDSNAYLMEKANPTMKIRPVSQYDTLLSDVLTLVSVAVANDEITSVDQGVKLAVTEMKNRLPSTVTVE
ncbi:MAG: extracellular solute-binding protein, partial [Treponema sp.]|nr:extracellular solute-binding protein [Treponema sp.]